MTRDADLATEAVDEAVAKAWEQMQRGREIESIAAWCRVVALNWMRSSWRRRAIERRAHARLRNEDVLEPSQQRVDAAIDVSRMLETLSDRQREVVVLHHMLDLPIEAVAQELGLSMGTVAGYLRKARTELAAIARADAARDNNEEARRVV